MRCSSDGVPDSLPDAPSPVVLLLIDVINPFDFEGREPLLEAAQQCAPRIAALRDECRRAKIPVIYVNDNFGRWRSDFRSIVEMCAAPEQAGRRVTELLSPGEQDYFVLKPRHSAFYCTALELLLEQLEARTLIVVGFATNICVLYTANDAHMRSYDVVVPSDCTASNSPQLTEQALAQMRLVSRARTEPSTELNVELLR